MDTIHGVSIVFLLARLSTSDAMPQWSNAVPLIAGGRIANHENWPWHVVIFYEFEIHCGGSLISPNVVLTAAHCVVYEGSREKFPTTNIQVMLGASSNSYQDPGRNAQEFVVKKFVTHPNYESDGQLSSDLALIFLARRVVSNGFVSPIRLPPADTLWYPNQAVGEVVGFGSAVLGGSSSSVLRHAVQPIVPLNNCGVAAVNQSPNLYLCAGFNSQPVESICSGDSGGGLVLKENLNGDGQQYYIEGIVSSTPAHNTCQTYAVFTKVRSFIRWIQSEIEKEASPNPRPQPFQQSPIQSSTNKPKPNPQPRPSQQSPIQSSTTKPNIIPWTDIQLLALNRHNTFRSHHGAAPLKLNARLNDEAQSWADTLIDANILQSKSPTSNGQNLYEASISRGTIPPLEVIEGAVKNWYSSRSVYNPSYPEASSFSQLVWKASTDMGVGLSSRNGRTVVIVFYSPAGNVWLNGRDPKYFRENVQI